MSKEQKCPLTNMVCPKNSDPEKGKYCPAWTEYMETNPQTGEERLQKECVFTAMPKFMIHTLKAANRPAAAIEETRNEIAKGFTQVAKTLHQVPKVTDNDSQNSRLTHNSDD